MGGLTFDDERSDRTEAGFAKAWTDRHVLVQVLWQLFYYRGAPADDSGAPPR